MDVKIGTLKSGFGALFGKTLGVSQSEWAEGIGRWAAQAYPLKTGACCGK